VVSALTWITSTGIGSGAAYVVSNSAFLCCLVVPAV
jgi:hypothetical protein